VLEVSDDGPGMSVRDAARAFDRFHRGVPHEDTPAGSPDATDAAGSGLGLSIVSAIAAAHGGHAQLSSEPGTGTTVRVWIPVSGT
jgi:two-component system OmpR family sensor kinase